MPAGRIRICIASVQRCLEGTLHYLHLPPLCRFLSLCYHPRSPTGPSSSCESVLHVYIVAPGRIVRKARIKKYACYQAKSSIFMLTWPWRNNITKAWAVLCCAALCASIFSSLAPSCITSQPQVPNLVRWSLESHHPHLHIGQMSILTFEARASQCWWLLDSPFVLLTPGSAPQPHPSSLLPHPTDIAYRISHMWSANSSGCGEWLLPMHDRNRAYCT